jgi:hypothetical protein
MFDLTNQFNQIFVFTLVMIGALTIMACLTYLIIIFSFRLPFRLWAHHEAASASSLREAPNLANVSVTKSSSDRPRMAA